MESKKGTFYGIELDRKNGKYDGSFLGKKYFECDKRKGLFITIKDIDKVIKKCKSMPRVTINSTVYVNKYGYNGIIKYIGIPFTQKNKAQNVYYGIELQSQQTTKGENNGIFVKKGEFKWKKQRRTTPGAPTKSKEQKKHKTTPKHTSSAINRSKSNTVKTKRKSKGQELSRSLSKSYTTSSKPSIFSKKQKSQKVIKRKKKSKVSAIAHSVKKKVAKKCASFKKNKSKKAKRGRVAKNDESNTKMRTKSATPTTHRAHIQNERKTVIMRRRGEESITTCTEERIEPSIQSGDESENMTTDQSEEKGESAFYDADETECECKINSGEEQNAINAINDALSLKNYRLFLRYVQPIKASVTKLKKSAKKRILNHLHLQRHENNLMIWQNILHLALFIVKSMHSFFSLDEKKQTWNFIDFLLQNGGDPLTKMTIKQGNEYEHKNVFRLMTEALQTYKQNEVLIMQRFVWLWSLVSNGIRSDNRLQKPSLLTHSATFPNGFAIVGDAYEELPSPKIIKKFLDFGCDLLHFCADDAAYYDFEQIRMSLAPNLLITHLKIDHNMRCHLDLIGRVVLYYEHYSSLRCDEVMSSYGELVEQQSFPEITDDIVSEIVSYTTTKIIYTDSKLQRINLVSCVLSKMSDYPPEWNDFLHEHVISNLTGRDKLKIKKLSKKWDHKSECDHWVSNIKNRERFFCYIDVFEYAIGYKTAQKIMNHHIKKDDVSVIKQYLSNEHAFKYLELYNLLFDYDLDKNASVKHIFQKLIDCAWNRDKSDIKHSKSNARKEFNNLYTQFCQNHVSDCIFEKNLLFILKQMLPSKKVSKRRYKFDFAQAILHCFKAGQLNTLVFLMDNKLLVDVERALRLFYVDDVMKRIIFGMDEFDEKQEDFLRLILNWTWQFTQNKDDMQTWYVKWYEDAQMVEDEDCCEIFGFYCKLSNDNVV